MSKSMKGMLFAVCIATMGSASAQVCSAQNGYKQDVGTYAAVVAAGDAKAFQSNRMVGDCSVKEVLSAVKGKPETTTVFFGPMTQDECSMYRSLSSIDSKLRQGKLADAYATNASLISKAGSIQITSAGTEAIVGAATKTANCISEALK